MADFRFHSPAECYIGQDAVYKIPLMLEGGPDRAILIADPELRDAGTASRLTEILEGRGIRIILFDDLDGKPTSLCVEAAAALVRGSRAPLVMGLGDIRALHVAKAVAGIASGDSSVDEWMDGTAPLRPPLPLIMIPTSYRDPFLMSAGIMLSDARTGKATFIQGQRGMESAIIFDPNLYGDTSMKTSAVALLDGLMGALEGYVSSKENFFSDMALREAIGLYIKALDVTMLRPEDPQARLNAAKACFLSGIGLASSAPGLGTALSFAISTRWHVPKAYLSVVILPYLLEFLVRSRLEKLAALAPLFGETDPEEGSAGAAARSIEYLRTRLGMLKIPSRINDFELPLEKLVEIAETARHFEFMNYLPRAMTVDEVFDFIKTIY